jgi:hypothetical protein
MVIRFRQEGDSFFGVIKRELANLSLDHNIIILKPLKFDDLA